jgi:hypothetical protein
MDILNIISWLRSSRRVTTIAEPGKSLIPVGVKNNTRDDKYAVGVITVEDLATQFKANILETTLFAFPFNYVVAPVMQETTNTIVGPSYFFGNTQNYKSYIVSGMISVQTNANFWYIGTISANEDLTGNLPWKVTGAVFAYDDSLPAGAWVQTGLCDGARFGDTNGGTVQAEYCTIVEDYNSIPGSIDLYLAVNSSNAIGDIFGNVAFQYEFFVENTFNLTFTNAI